MADAENEERGQRLKAVREEFVDGEGEIQPQSDFAAQLQRVATELFGAKGVEHKYGQSLVNRLEKGNQRPSLQDIEVYAALDPKKREREWLAWGERTVLDLSHAKPVSKAGKARAAPIADRARETGAEPAKKAKKKGRGNGAA